MADVARRLPQNVAGDLYVDETCIDCATCREMVPSVYGYAESVGKSVVVRQPADEATRLRAHMALVACPTASIGTRPGADLRAAARAFPEPVVPGVLFCGYTSRDSFGAWSYLVLRPQGNVLVDSPRAAGLLMDRIEALGGVATMFLTHADDVADHEAFRARFRCERVMHRADLSRDTRGVERVLEGDDPVRLADDLTAIPVPGHTPGSAALLWTPASDADEARGGVLFSGDHLWADGDRLDASREVCWHSWPQQTRSMERLLAHRFAAVLPGHGGLWTGRTVDETREALGRLVERMRGPRRG